MLLFNTTTREINFLTRDQFMYHYLHNPESMVSVDFMNKHNTSEDTLSKVNSYNKNADRTSGNKIEFIIK